MNGLFKNRYFRLLLLLIVFSTISNLGYKKYKIQGDSMEEPIKKEKLYMQTRLLTKLTNQNEGM